MARELSQLLLDEGIISPAGLLRALARQREAGGTLDTALLELGLVTEVRLVSALARAADLPAAPLSVYEQVDARARRVFPSKVAERHGLAPFALEGRELSLVATCPVDLGLLDEVSFMLSLHLTPHVGPEWRVRSLIQRLYGGTLPSRLARLAEQSAARGTSPGVVAASPVPEAASRPAPGGEPVTAEPAAGIFLGPAMPAVKTAPPRIDAPRPMPPPPGFSGFTREEGEPLEPMSDALAEALETFEEAGPGAAAGALGPAPVRPSEAPDRLDRSAPPRWTLEQARAELVQARTRDEVVVTALRYARDFFQFATIFAVTRDVVAGHDGLGPEGDARDLARTVAIYASDLGIFRTTIETMAPYLGRVDRSTPGNQAVLDALGRGSPRTVLVTPILLRHRPVCLLYADNGADPVSARRLGDLLVFCSTIGAAFERIIVARKVEQPPGEERLALEAASPGPVAETSSQVGPAAVEEPIATQLVEPLPTQLVRPPGLEPAAETPAQEPPAPGPQPAEPITAEETTAQETTAEEATTEATTAEPVQTVRGFFEQPEPAWRGPTGDPDLVSAAEADYIAAGGDLEPEPLFVPELPPPLPAEAAPTPEVTTELPLPEPEPEPEAEPAPPPQVDAGPEPLPPVPLLEAPAPEEPEPQGIPDDPAYLVGAYLITAPATPPRAQLLARLVGHAAVAAPILCELLPGPLEVDPAALATTPAARHGPVFEALAAMGPPAVPPLLAVLNDADPSRRRAAVALLGAIGDPATLVAITDRCLDTDPAVAEAAREALIAQRGTLAMRPIPERLRRALASGLASRAGPAARALMALRDAESIPSLIQALEGSDPATAAAAAEALAAITLQRHGTAPRPWLLWWRENRGRGRAEWLFGGLTAEDQEVRAAAAEELARVAPPPVRYTPDMTPAEREPAARAWASWFTRSGYRL